LVVSNLHPGNLQSEGSVGYRAFYIENEFTPFAAQPSRPFLLMKKIDLMFEEARDS
jgi:hypothetical protein